ncbi:MAG: DUF4347 domain-containing protein, partial [bacterium]|nr:DUF4347 domain-containing protein [bacterium]
MKRPVVHNRFELENLEPRILLSADPGPGSMAGVLSDDLGPDLDTLLQRPAVAEVMTGAEAHFQENFQQISVPYDPSRKLDDIFSGLSAENLSEAVGNSSAGQVVFIDGSIGNYQALLTDLAVDTGAEDPDLVIHLLDADKDGLAQITDYLGRHEQDIAGIHILSHGSAGGLQLGSSSLNGST